MNEILKRYCHGCQRRLELHSFRMANATKLTEEEIQSYWEDQQLQFYCCECFSRISRGEEQEFCNVCWTILMGLSSSGKSMFLALLSGKKTLDAKTLLPTRGIQSKKIKIGNTMFIFWELPGTDRYMSKWLSNPQTYFSNAPSILFFIDLQDIDNYEKSLEYLQNVILLINDSTTEINILFTKAHSMELNDVQQDLHQAISELKSINQMYYIELDEIVPSVNKEVKTIHDLLQNAIDW